ncbi:RDD domain containing protein OS=Tsukamurella paurometabola (strain ATCC 8368 / DSM / CCUG 35730/ CIP 100753 / JCM 10117 / KCTC 9821 / NBRC 16120 / NCIMB 702349 / NCTC 13040) OX=521096 GN=Tpau_1511 PE=4 SV=1 [Tsukamurella paurometabola]|uniref:RDD domain containing protein n=1 Tax=Tsukamurella paurometabola (strain ATCC 8368 / DSM 20162 / CCUG 35730 / CIP 100753 / JCM 10117 / KCTC 9821 / NBRC 16120 / NCIMB 702349 / NCTC 13040) TaxID=521096 RepID=D5UXP3_TSUPD|nr:RDD family protein [Tsukamurella paurometabola]ADG78135.1 RDD domain containing protein [Tsukamurella paurometabola DSM 20162]SUP30347.1 RDD family [Tsukamurella paurometabola]
MGRETGSWLSGASAALPEGAHGEYRGAGLGLPRDGVGSIAPTGRRVLALMLDWVPSALIALAIAGPAKVFGGEPTAFDTSALGIWFVVGVLAVTLFGFTPGQYFAGLRVARIEDPGMRVGLLRALGRNALIVFLVPPLIQDVDGRGMQDRATGTVVVRSR